MSGVEFDPGFAPYIMAFQGSVEYLYSDINKYKNLSQKKFKFMQYYKKILEVFDNNLGFYVGCLMWASYIKTLPEQEILNNNALGTEYNEEKDTAETDFMIRFVDLFPKDMKYFLGQNFEFEPWIKKLLYIYKEFLVINKGFVNSKNNIDIKLPKSLKSKDLEKFQEIIKGSISSGNLSSLLHYKNLII